MTASSFLTLRRGPGLLAPLVFLTGVAVPAAGAVARAADGWHVVPGWPQASGITFSMPARWTETASTPGIPWGTFFRGGRYRSSPTWRGRASWPISAEMPVWDGRDAGDRATPAGVYFVRVRGAIGTSTVRVRAR